MLGLGIYWLQQEDTGGVQAASQSSTASDLQLMARAINGEARGEPYEGQVSRCCYLKPCKKLAVS